MAGNGLGLSENSPLHTRCAAPAGSSRQRGGGVERETPVDPGGRPGRTAQGDLDRGGPACGDVHGAEVRDQADPDELLRRDDHDRGGKRAPCARRERQWVVAHCGSAHGEALAEQRGAPDADEAADRLRPGAWWTRGSLRPRGPLRPRWPMRARNTMRASRSLPPCRSRRAWVTLQSLRSGLAPRDCRFAWATAVGRRIDETQLTVG